MRDDAMEWARAEQRVGRIWICWICGVFVALQITIVAFMPPHARWITSGLLTMVTIVAVITVAMEASFKRAAARAAVAAADAGVADEPRFRRPRERVSPLIQRAYYLARGDQSASHIAGSCDIPEAFAALIIDDVRRTASRKGRTLRDSSGRTSGGGRAPRNPPAI